MIQNAKLDNYLSKYMKKKLPQFNVGDTVDVIVRIQEGDKERKQTFQGTVIAFHGAGVTRTFTVRRIVQGEGVERIFPLHSPMVVTVKIVRKGRVRRAKLYYLRDRVGKATKVREKIWGAAEAQAAALSAEGAAKEVMDAVGELKSEKKDRKDKKAAKAKK